MFLFGCVAVRLTLANTIYIILLISYYLAFPGDHVRKMF